MINILTATTFFAPIGCVAATTGTFQILNKGKRTLEQTAEMSEKAVQPVKNLFESEKEKTSRLIQQTEADIAEAIAREAPVLAPGELQEIQEIFDEALTSFYEEHYSEALRKTKEADTRAKKLISRLGKAPTTYGTATVTTGPAHLYSLKCDDLHSLLTSSTLIRASFPQDNQSTETIE